MHQGADGILKTRYVHREPGTNAHVTSISLSGKNRLYPVTADRGKELNSTLLRTDVTGHFKGE